MGSINKTGAQYTKNREKKTISEEAARKKGNKKEINSKKSLREIDNESRFTYDDFFTGEIHAKHSRGQR